MYDSSYGLNSANKPYYYAKNYSYLAGNVIKYTSRSQEQGDTTIYTDEDIVKQTLTSSGDINYQVDSSNTLIPASPISGSRLENKVTYIDNPNPFAIFSDPVRSPHLRDDIGIGSQQASPKKLFTQHSYTYDTWSGSSTNSNSSSVQYSYTFRPDGYPSAFRETFSDNGGLKVYKAVLLYE